MSISNITSIAGRYKKRKRIARGTGSGHGKTAGKGSKGQKSRAGCAINPLKEGGQMPLFRRLPKRGFRNFKFAVRYQIVNVSQLERFDDGAVVGIQQLRDLGIIDNIKKKVKILGDGVLTKKLKVSAHKFSKQAEQKIIESGGNINIV